MRTVEQFLVILLSSNTDQTLPQGNVRRLALWAGLSAALRNIGLHTTLLVVFFGAFHSVWAETIHDARSWVNLTVQGTVSRGSRWHWYFDAQDRNRDSGRDLDQIVVRPALGYYLTKRSSLWAGYAYTATFTGGGHTNEHRSWQQYLWTGSVGSRTLALRTRTEQRFFEDTSRTAWRIRQQLRLTDPWEAHPRISTVQWEELLVHANNTERTKRGLDQNRAFAGFGFQVNERTRIDAGYLNQYVHPGRMRHILSSVINVNLDH